LQENGTKPEFGLAPPGVDQARSAGESLRKVRNRAKFKSRILEGGCGVVLNWGKWSILCVQELEEMGVPVDSVKIRYSPFSRTTETARAVAGVLGIPFDGPSCKVSGSWMKICSVRS
jgi:broad specificity phosphatase PhoE